MPATSPAPSAFPTVSLVVACRNEAGFIERCLASLAAQDYPADRMEFLIVDGASDDGTPDRVAALAAADPRIRLLSNPRRLTPFAMNIGLQGATGEVRILVNAHSELDPGFVRASVDALARTGADAVGGRLATRAAADTPVARAIPLAADSPFGSGGDRYRTRTEPGFVRDTLPYCAYPLATFEKFGWIDEALTRDQDEEFNYRILRGGGRIYFDPAIRSTLVIRSDLRKLFRQHYQYGYFKPLVMRKIGGALTWRQMIPAAFVAFLALAPLLALLIRRLRIPMAAVLALYAALAARYARRAAREAGDPSLSPLIALCFLVLHVSYGAGTLRGALDFLVRAVDRDGAVDPGLSR